MVQVQLQIQDLGKLQEMMNALGPSNRRRLHTVGAKALEVEARRHVSRYVPSRHSTANALGGKQTDHYLKGLRGIAGHATQAGGEVVIPIAGISRAFHDIDLTTPTRYGRNFYAIPKHAQSYGHTVAETRSRGWKTFSPGQKNDPDAPKILLGYKSKGKKPVKLKGKKPVKLFILTEHVHQRQDPSLLPSSSQCASIVSEAMTTEINRRLANAR